MSGIVDLPLVILQKAQHAAEAAAASFKLFESEASHRLTSIEGRLPALVAGQHAQELALMRIADTQSEHTAQFEGMDRRFDGIDKQLAEINQTLANILAKLP